MLKKNSGVKMSATGFIPFSMISNWFVPERMIPAANAPMMRADPARAARAARSSRKANAETRSTPRTRIRFTSPKMRGASAAPSATAATRNPTATASVHTTPTALTAAPAASPETTPRITRPSTSSMTAAPRMSRASVESMHFRSERTRAVMPTEVAVSVAPTKIATVVASDGAGAGPCSGDTQYRKPNRNGTATPTSATAVAGAPTRAIALRSVSRPISNSSTITPISARKAMTGRRGSSGPVGMTPSTLDPRTMPATSSPSTAGCPSRSASSAENFPATSISPSTPKKRTTSPSPAAAPSRSGGRAAQSHALHRLRDVGMELEGVVEEREIDRLAVLRVDLDLAGRSPADDPDVPRRVRQPDLLRGGLEPALDGAVVERRREARLRLDFVQEAVVAEVHLADVDAVVERRDEDEERKQAAGRARAARTSGKAPHHWDWAPSTISFTSFESAIFRPSASLGGSYSPSTVSPWRCHSVLPSRWSRISTSTLIWTRRWVTDTWPRPGWSATGVSAS